MMPLAYGPAIRVFFYQSSHWTTASPVLIACHGKHRDANNLMSRLQGEAERAGVLLICPEFSNALFPKRAGYNSGNVYPSENAQLRPNPPEQWAFSVIEPLFDLVGQSTGATAPEYYLFGHSAGCQFVHRFLMYMPQARVKQAVIANAGWYMMPSGHVGYPYDLRGSFLTDEHLRAYFHRPVVLLLGSMDTKVGGRSLDMSPQAMMQGRHRLERGRNYFNTCRQVAVGRGWTLNWRCETVRGVGHDDAAMGRVAIQCLFPQGWQHAAEAHAIAQDVQKDIDRPPPAYEEVWEETSKPVPPPVPSAPAFS